MVFEALFSTNVITALLVILFLYLIKLTFSGPSNIPPGPMGFPIIGSLPMMAKKSAYKVYRELRKKYGDIFSVRLGPRLVVVINGYDNIREAFVKNGDVFSDRPDLFFIKHVLKEKGIAASSGKFWKETRTFALSTLRDFGFGRKSMEANITEEITFFLETIDEAGGEPIDLLRTTQISVSNVICSMIFGQRFSYNDEKFQRLLFLLDEDNRVNLLSGMISFFPYLRYLPGDPFESKTVFVIIKGLFAFMDEMIESHRNSFDPNSPRDYIDAFFTEQQKHKDKDIMNAYPHLCWHTFVVVGLSISMIRIAMLVEAECLWQCHPNQTDDNLKYSILNFFAAGTQTTQSTIRWAVLLMLHNRDVHDRLGEEIERVIGSSRKPSLKDRPLMPYFEAFLTETMRFANIAPLSVPHGAKSDIHFKGFTIPKGALIIPNLDSALNDADTFPDPEKFNPNRFLDSDGKLCGTEKVIPFSIGLYVRSTAEVIYGREKLRKKEKPGRRSCIAESMARMELFLYLTSLVQRFNFLPEDENNLPSLEPLDGFTRTPDQFHCRAIRKKLNIS